MIYKYINDFNFYTAGSFMIIFLLGTGVILTVGTRGIQFRKLGYAFKLLAQKNHCKDGDISPFQALATSLAATLGIGNIVGVAAAISAGGPGAIFWMWMTALFGGALKYAESLLAVKYRVTNEHGEKSGGPMHYIKTGMAELYGGNWTWLGWIYAFFGLMASFGVGNMLQSNSVAHSLQVTTGVSPLITGSFITSATALVIFGGIKSIGKVIEKIVPAMVVLYISGALIIIFRNLDIVPSAFGLIFTHAFSPQAVGGGLFGTVIRYGLARGILTNEAGLGSASIAHAASKNPDPVAQGLIASIGTFIDTLVVCTMTAIVILTSGLVHINKVNGLMSIKDNLYGAALTATAFESQLPIVGGVIVSLSLIAFGFSTILGWYYYGSKCLEFIAGLKAVNLYKSIWIGLVFFGASYKVNVIWNISDSFNSLMAIPNLIAMLALSPKVFSLTSEYEDLHDDLDKKELKAGHIKFPTTSLNR
ncbi:alanine/glycine:cation symporter family protein [Fusibacter sp. JL216-2]|uniref:alanine/glycine:cation symporter family protein n=1 Tax=Fusibacter sp. JL216-2 TaxID=3071453 RepID=UPI003D32576A